MKVRMITYVVIFVGKIWEGGRKMMIHSRNIFVGMMRVRGLFCAIYSCGVRMARTWVTRLRIRGVII
jgi:hypothetical protein